MTDTASGASSGALVAGGLWMLILAIFLSWLPVLGPLVAGFLGGRMIGEEERALGVALIPGAWLGGATQSGSPQTA